MATGFVVTHPPRPSGLPGPNRSVRVHWGTPVAQGGAGPLVLNESGEPLVIGLMPGRTVHVRGTFAGATVRLRGRNFDDGVGFILTDPLGASLTFATEGGREVLENPAYIFPEVVGGDGTTALEVALFGHLSDRP